jgi:hypothetical protein
MLPIIDQATPVFTKCWVSVIKKNVFKHSRSQEMGPSFAISLKEAAYKVRDIYRDIYKGDGENHPLLYSWALWGLG